MPEYNYRALNPRGMLITGSLSGEDGTVVQKTLKNEGLIPVEIKKNTAVSLVLPSFERKISEEALSHFCRQLAVIMRAGVNVLKGLEIMVRQTADKRMRSEIDRIYREVQTGRTISEAMADQGSLIPRLLTGMVATGEASGTLEEVLESMSRFYEKEHRVKQKIKSASIYPVIMAVMAAALIAFFFNFLLPQMVALITSNGGQLPRLTRIVMGISEFTTNYFILLLGFSLGMFAFFNRYFKSFQGRLNRDKFIRQIPLLGKTLRSVATMRFSRTAHILVKSGLPLLQGLDYIKQNVNNALAEKAVDYAIEGLQRGESLAANLKKADFFDSMTIQMVAIGEETGELERVLEEMADFYDQEADAGFTKLLALAEPLMLVVIGGIVSTIIISVMLPMLDMFSHIQR